MLDAPAYYTKSEYLTAFKVILGCDAVQLKDLNKLSTPTMDHLFYAYNKNLEAYNDMQARLDEMAAKLSLSEAALKESQKESRRKRG